MICRFSLKSVMLFSLLIFSPLASTTDFPELSKQDKSYVALGAHFNRFKSIELIMVNAGEVPVAGDFPLTAHTTAASIILGTYITDYIKTEVRLGQGVGSDTLDDSLELNLGQWFNWYMGAAYGMTDYATVYAQYGLSFYNAEVTRYQTQRFIPGGRLEVGRVQTVYPSRTLMEEELFGEHFSTSWLVGIDFAIFDDWYWSFEYGRLLNDADTGIKVYQLNSLLKYEF
jgi:Outer membrane protein beta-barrel domain